MYKRQGTAYTAAPGSLTATGALTVIVWDYLPVSYTHLDVYKRQVQNALLPYLAVS